MKYTLVKSVICLAVVSFMNNCSYSHSDINVEGERQYIDYWCEPRNLKGSFFAQWFVDEPKEGYPTHDECMKNHGL